MSGSQSPEILLSIKYIYKVPTRLLIEELFDRVDDNLYAPEPRDAPYLDQISRGEKFSLYKLLEGLLEDYKTENPEDVE